MIMKALILFIFCTHDLICMILSYSVEQSSDTQWDETDSPSVPILESRETELRSLFSSQSAISAQITSLPFWNPARGYKEIEKGRKYKL